MKDKIELSKVLASANGDLPARKRVFALLSLGVIESLENGALTCTDAVNVFFNARNCLYVRKRLGDVGTDEVMSRGVQLPDLFDTLPQRTARREFERELASMKSLCLRLLGARRAVA